MTRKEWLATQLGKDPRAILKACTARHEISRTPQPDTVEYGQSPAEVHGFEPFKDVFEIQQEMRD